MSLFDRVAGQVGQNYLTRLGQISPLVKFGTDKLSSALTSRVKAGNHVLSGGLNLHNYAKVMEEFQSIDLARKNLFMFSATNLTTGTSPDMNMFVIDYSYSPFTVRGDAVAVGAGSFDNVTGVEAIRLQVTCMDDVGGSVKTWFKNLKRTMAPGDGTLGLPIEYLIRVGITHAFANDGADNASSAFLDSFVVRPESIQLEGSRRDDGLQELQLSFIQFDTFTNLV